MSSGPNFAGHCLEYNRNIHEIIVYGGDPSSDMWMYSIARNTWANILPAGSSLPTARGYMGCAFDPATSTFYIQGGSGAAQEQDLWSYNITSRRWKSLDLGSPGVARSSQHMKFFPTLNSLIIFFGGYTTQSATVYVTDPYLYDLRYATGWKLIPYSGMIPPGRDFFLTGTIL